MPDVIEGQVGLIDVDVAKTASGVPYVYSIVKIRLEPVEVEYNLTLTSPASIGAITGVLPRATPPARGSMVYDETCGATTWAERRPR